MRITDQILPFAAFVHAAGTAPEAARTRIDRGQSGLSTEVARPRRSKGRGLQQRRLAPLDSFHSALQDRLISTGASASRADAILREHVDGRVATLLAGFPDATVDFLPVVLGAAVLVVLPDGRAGVLMSAPGDALHRVTAAGAEPAGTGGQPHPGSEWLAEGIADGSIDTFVAIRLAAVARGVVDRLATITA